LVRVVLIPLLNFQIQSFVRKNSDEYNKQLAYWVQELEGASTVEFQRDNRKAVTSENEGGMITLSVEPEVVKMWKECLTKQGCTVFMGGLCILHVLLARWCNQDDIVTGAAVANRNIHPSYSERLGSYANILTIRSNSTGNPSYAEMLRQIRSKVLGSWSAQDIPYHHVIAELGSAEFRGFNVMYAM